MDPASIPSASSPRRERARRIAAVLATSIVGISVAVAPASAQTDDAWTQFQGGPGHAGFAASGPAPGYSVDWSLPVPLGGPGDQYGLSAPVVAGDTAIAVGPAAVIGVDTGTGEQLWSVTRDLGPSVPAAVASAGGQDVVVYTEGFGDGPPDPSASPTESPSSSPSPSGADGDGGGAGDEPFDSHVAAFDLATQEPLWDPVPLSAVSRTGITVGDGMAFLGVNGGTVYAIDLAKGSVAWTAELGRPAVTQPAFQDGTVIVGVQTDQDNPHPTVIALDASTGEEQWRTDDEGQAAIVSTASVADGTVYAIFTGQQESSIDAFDLGTGERRWRARFTRFLDPSTSVPPVVTDDAVYITDIQGETYRLDPTTGARRWEFALNEGVIRVAPVVVGDHVLVASVDGTLAVLETSGGDLVWRSVGDGYPLRAIAVTAERVIAVRSGPDAGLVAFVHDDQAALVREISPTTLNLGVLLGSFAVAAVVIVGLVLLIGRMVAGRMGPAFPDDGTADDEFEDEDDGDELEEDPGSDPEGTEDRP